MRSFIRRSIQRQLTAIGLLASLGGLLVAGTALLVFDLRNLRHAMVDDLQRTAAMVAANATVALAFANAADATEILGTLRAESSIVSGCIFLPSGEPFACYERDRDFARQPLQVMSDGLTDVGGYLTLALGIQRDGSRLGTFVVRSDTTALAALVRHYLAVLALVLFSATAVALWLSSRLQRVLSVPILRLVEAMGRVPSDERHSVHGDEERPDEIGMLVRGFNDMLVQIGQRDAQLERAQRELVATSRQAGMSEVATDVLHNVGNVLNSVNVSCSLVTERLRSSKLANLERVSGLLEAHSADLATFVTTDREGKLLPRYLHLLAEQLTSERTAALEELNALARNVEHIKVIVAQQQSYARTAGVREIVAVQQIVEDALQLNMTRMVRHRITLLREFESVPEICVDRHRVLQILVNLVANAVQALTEGPDEHRRLTVAIAATGAGGVRVVVRDTGIGIAADNLTRIFQHGFTTKTGGHGFGLHSAALAAKEMGGTLTAESAGAGCGATFTLEIARDMGQETGARSAAVPDHSGSEAPAPISTACAPSQGQTGAHRS